MYFGVLFSYGKFKQQHRHYSLNSLSQVVKNFTIKCFLENLQLINIAEYKLNEFIQSFLCQEY